MQNPKQLTALRSPRTASVALAGKPLLLADQGLTPSTDLWATPSRH